ncbi:MAG: cation diffusion facilitator family transporter [Candidatus Caldatribacteriaceae bacterium]
MFSLFLALFALQISLWGQTPQKTYGYRRAEILAALFNTLTLFGASAYILKEAFERLFHPLPLHFSIAMGVAVAGLVGNLFSVFLLLPSSRTSLNVRSAFLHLFADTLSSTVVVGACL